MNKKGVLDLIGKRIVYIILALIVLFVLILIFKELVLGTIGAALK